MAENDRPLSPEAEAEAALAPFLAAARAEHVAPRITLLNAVLADAAAVSAERQPAVAPARREGRFRFRGLLDPVGGWRGMAALGLCAALGFWLGLSGQVAIDGTTVWAGVADTSDPVAAFFDMAAEG